MDNFYRPYLMTVAEVRDETPDVRSLRLEFQDQSVRDTFDTLGSAGPPPEGQALLLRIPFNLKED